MIRDDKKVLLLQKQQPIKPTIYMYTSAGKLIEQIQVQIAHQNRGNHDFNRHAVVG